MSDAAIETIDLRKTYRGARGTVEAVRGIELEVPYGQSFGLLGPNGAGKTTTLGMLTTRVAPTGGDAFVAGANVHRDPVAVKRRIGVVSQHNTLDRQLTALENLEFRGRYFGLSTRAARRRGTELLERFDLAQKANDLVHRMSGGQAQRVMIARAMMNSPEIIFLDEPTSGLDPQTRVNLWDMLREMRRAGQTIVLTTHYLEEAEAICERIAIVDHGQVLVCDTQEALHASVGGDSVVTLSFETEAGLADALTDFEQIPGVARAAITANTIALFAEKPPQVVPQAIRTSVARGLVITDIDTRKPDLETVFLVLTGREYRE
ncbi:MAG TPA: ATP-binding cassette domain-containing protein [Jatrophihabitantaceae bacterium]|jgi:ABC-2 type transport system ATP-binding protein